MEEYVDELRVLADRAFPDFDEKVRERLALNQYLSQLDNPQVAFNVKQKRPEKLIHAVSTTLEMESYLLPRPHKVATVDIQESPTVAAVQNKQDAMMEMLQATRRDSIALKSRCSAQTPLRGAIQTPLQLPLRTVQMPLSVTSVVRQGILPVAVQTRDEPVDQHPKTQ